MTQLTRFERRKRATRQKLKQAAAELILEHGYHAVSVQNITDRADVGRGTFYIHFRDKDDILWAMVREKIDEIHAQIEQEVRADQPVEQRIYRIWLITFRHAHANRDLMRLVFGDQGHISNRFMDYFASLMIDDLSSNIQKLPIKLPAPFAANYLLGAQMRLVVWWISEQADYTPEQMAVMFYEMTTGSPAPRQDGNQGRAPVVGIE
jgi:AcrR family transcriptional regulator